MRSTSPLAARLVVPVCLLCFGVLGRAAAAQEAINVALAANGAVVVADSVYGDSGSNLGQLSLSTDNIFGDGWEEQLATVTPSGDAYTVSLLVRV